MIVKNKRTQYKFIGFQKTSCTFSYLFQGKRYEKTYAFDCINSANLNYDGMKYRDEYNKILQTIPKHTLYEACVLGNKSALLIREHISKGLLQYKEKA